MQLKEMLEENTNFSFYEEISIGGKISVESKEIFPAYMIKMLLFDENVPSATINPLAFLFKEELESDNESKYEYYLIFFDEEYKKYTNEIIEAYNKNFEEELQL